MDQRGTHQRARGAPRGHRAARAGYDDRLLESSCHLWPTSGGPPGDSVYDRGLGNGTPCDASNGLRVRLAPRSRRRRAQSLLYGQSHEHGNGEPRHRPSDSSSRWIGADERVATRMVVSPDSQHAHYRGCQRSAALAPRAKSDSSSRMNAFVASRYLNDRGRKIFGITALLCSLSSGPATAGQTTTTAKATAFTLGLV